MLRTSNVVLNITNLLLLLLPAGINGTNWEASAGFLRSATIIVAISTRAATGTALVGGHDWFNTSSIGDAI